VLPTVRRLSFSATQSFWSRRRRRRYSCSKTRTSVQLCFLFMIVRFAFRPRAPAVFSNDALLLGRRRPLPHYKSQSVHCCSSLFTWSIDRPIGYANSRPAAVTFKCLPREKKSARGEVITELRCLSLTIISPASQKVSHYRIASQKSLPRPTIYR